MFDSARFLLLLTLVASISVGAPSDVKQTGDAGKDKPHAQEEKGEKGGYEPPPPVVTEHTVDFGRTAKRSIIKRSPVIS